MRLFKGVTGFCERFRRSDKGNMALVASMVMMPIIIISGGLLDYSKAVKAKAQMSATLDNAVLAAMQQYSLDETTDYEQVVRDYVAKNFTEASKNQFVKNVAVSDMEISESGEMSAKLTAEVETNFIKVMGIDNFNVESRASAMVGGSAIEVALVLDNTGSMKGEKLAALEAAAGELVEAIMPDGQNDKVKVALVPFADYVNIGTENRDEPGLEVPADYSHTPNGQNCWDTYPNSTEQCTPIKKWRTCYNDGVPYDCYKTVDWDCTGDKGSPVEVCEDKPTKHYKFYGVMGSRPESGDIVKTPEGGAPGLMLTWDLGKHINPITPLTTDKATVTAGLAKMKAKRNTYIPSGLVWGWRVLSSAAPFTGGVSEANKSVNKVIVLMTDGANTKSMRRWGGNPVMNHSDEVWGHNKSNKNDANEITRQLCTDIKNDTRIMVYTIAFDVDGESEIKQLMQDCAVNGGRYYDAEDSTTLADAFKQIGVSLLNLRLTK